MGEEGGGYMGKQGLVHGGLALCVCVCVCVCVCKTADIATFSTLCELKTSPWHWKAGISCHNSQYNSETRDF